MNKTKEAEFAEALTAKLKRFGYDVTRIESHSTGNGIPDMFVQGHGCDYWLELKATDKIKNKVGWRPGQQAWMIDYHSRHYKQKNCLTLVKTDNGDIYAIPMWQVYKENKVTEEDYAKLDYIDPIILRVLTHNVCMNKNDTYRTAIAGWMEHWFPYIGYDTDVLWAEETVDIDSVYDKKVFFKAQVHIITMLIH